ncbi:hypothetical protein Avbf_17174 [Armadillidium vulgare]|nr:hypothetical protein Avbf_17174 [Armadillidium vulgare]
MTSKIITIIVETKDALLHAINEEYVEAVEIGCVNALHRKRRFLAHSRSRIKPTEPWRPRHLSPLSKPHLTLRTLVGVKTSVLLGT